MADFTSSGINRRSCQCSSIFTWLDNQPEQVTGYYDLNDPHTSQNNDRNPPNKRQRLTEISANSMDHHPLTIGESSEGKIPRRSTRKRSPTKNVAQSPVSRGRLSKKSTSQSSRDVETLERPPTLSATESPTRSSSPAKQISREGLKSCEPSVHFLSTEDAGTESDAFREFNNKIMTSVNGIGIIPVGLKVD